jgi:hypothetical protein
MPCRYRTPQSVEEGIMISVEEKLFHLLEEIAEENQRLLEMLQAGWTLAEAENQLGGAEAGMTRHVPARHDIHQSKSPHDYQTNPQAHTASYRASHRL